MRIRDLPLPQPPTWWLPATAALTAAVATYTFLPLSARPTAYTALAAGIAIWSVLLVRHRERAAEHLRLAEQRVGSILEQASDLVTILKPDGQITYVSRSIESILGIPVEASAELGLQDVVHPDDLERVAAAWGELLARGGTGPPVRFRIRHADGSWRHLESVAKRIDDDGGEIAVLVTSRDVTEWHEVTERLRFQAQLLGAAGEAVMATDTDGTIAYWNAAAEAMYGWPAAEAIGRDVMETTVPAPSAEQAEAIMARLRAGEPWTGEFDVTRRDGSTFTALVTNTPLMDDTGAVAGVIGVSVDITERKRDELATQRSAVQQATAADIGHSALSGTEIGELRHMVESAVVAVTGAAHCAVAFHDPDDEVDVHNGLDDDRSVEVPFGLGRLRGTLQVRVDGDENDPLSGNDHAFLRALANILGAASDRVTTQDELEHLAFHDALTGLPNRALFTDRLEHARARAARADRRYAVLFLDLDGFKLVNDGWGHAAGDGLLIAVAERLRQIVRPADTVARFGGDEFAVLCEDLAGSADVELLAQRLLNALSDSFPVEGTPISVSASIGIVMGREDSDPQGLLRDADVAMYRAKERGHARYEVFDGDQRSEARRRLAIAAALPDALDEARIEVHFQPTVQVGTGRVVGAEALARWPDGIDGRPIPPGEFIPIAEEVGLIGRLGAYVLERACAHGADWQDRTGGAFLLGVNVSARQLADPALPGMVADILDRTGLHAGNLLIEMTESATMEGSPTAALIFEELHLLGVRIAIDDFGTGYSSLSYLRRLPIDVMKVDRSFVSGLGSDLQDSTIVGAVIRLAHSMGMVAVAEGVETEQQHEEIRRLGGDHAQGYLWSRPVPAEEFAHLIDLDAHGHDASRRVTVSPVPQPIA